MKSFYFLSDLHLSVIEDCHRINRMIEDMQTDPHLSAIFFVGDIFEFNLNYRFTIFKDHFIFLAKIKSLIDQGIEIHFFSGNHDPGLADFYKEIGIICHHQPYTLTCISHQQTYQIHIEHGDLQEMGLIKSLFCRFVRLKSVMFLAKLIPIDLIYKITQKAAQKQRYQSPPIAQEIIDKIWRHMAINNENVWIMGHFHRLVHLENHYNQKLFVLGDGTQYLSFLRLEIFDECEKEISFTLYRLKENQRVKIGMGDHDF